MDAEDLSSFCHACRVNILTHWTISPTAHQVSLIHHYHIGNMWSTIFSFQLLYLSMNLHWNTTPTFIYVCAIPFLQPTQHSSFKTSGYFHFFLLINYIHLFCIQPRLPLPFSCPILFPLPSASSSPHLSVSVQKRPGLPRVLTKHDISFIWDKLLPWY